MKTVIVLLNLLLNSIACKSEIDNTKISLHNKTIFSIDSVKITSYGVNFKFENVKPNQKVDKKFNFSHNGIKKGAFYIEVFVKDSLKNSSSFGYFDNPVSIKQYYNVTIYDDYKIKEMY